MTAPLSLLEAGLFEGIGDELHGIDTPSDHARAASVLLRHAALQLCAARGVVLDDHERIAWAATSMARLSERIDRMLERGRREAVAS